MIVTIEKGRILQPFKQTQISGRFELTKVTKKRSSGQNKYFHGYLFPKAAKAFTKHLRKPISMELAKEVLKSTCGVFFVPAVNEWVVIPTSKQNTKQATIFIEKSLKYVAEKTGEYLEEPNEEQWRQIKE